jgi:hypothetical protein
MIWDVPGPDYEQPTPEQSLAVDALLIQQKQSIRWLRRELLKLRAKTGPEAESQAAQSIKLEVVKTLEEMLPQAKRAAKRGKPALLRLIVRTIKTKL